METTFVSQAEVESQPREHDESALVGDMVLQRLGSPRELFRVDVKQLWGHNYRVNVLCNVGYGMRLPIVRITDSFFVTFTGEGLASQPAITKKYPLAI